MDSGIYHAIRQARITGSQLINAYAQMNVDIRRFITPDQTISLTEDEHTGLLRYTPCIPGDEHFYQQLSRQAWYYQEEKQEFQIAIRVLERYRARRVVEIGSGRGAFGSRLTRSYSAAEYVGMELNSDAADSARSRGLNITQDDYLSFAHAKEGRFDAACSFQVLEHLPDPSRYFQAVHTVLQRQGISICSVPAEDSFISVGPVNALNAPPHHLTRWTDKALREFPANHGFELLELIHVPVESIHTRWFFSALIRSQLQRDKRLLTRFFRHHVVQRITVGLLSRLLSGVSIDSTFGLPGHTVIAIHRKACSS